MAILATVETQFGEDKELYIRLNNVEASNHGMKATALFRGFISKEAFEDGKNFMYEKEVQFNADVSSNLWEQAYSHIKLEINGKDV
ncbi:hypothetical protein NVP1183O_17 [Vibrio phage 1.183.O._10N.286.48.B7]|nr:hypothetical protein NVP1183O_17 [Vibrio phage 1.183.O._10N.286.48.B7]